MVITNIEGLRDPFVLVTDDAYYVYGTGVSGRDWDDTVWACYKNGMYQKVQIIQKEIVLFKIV